MPTFDELDANARKHIAESNFALPKEQKYPIHDLSHAKNALARASGKPEEATVKAAVYKKWPSLNPSHKLEEGVQMCERGFFKAQAIKLSEGVKNPDVQVLRVGKFNHPKYGEFEITPLTLQEMKQNFDSKVRGVDVAFDFFHKSDEEASGWPTDLYLLHNDTELWAKVDWTPVAQQKLSEREIRYFSPDFAFKWTDPETGKTFKNVLFGGGLTNRPFVKDMAAIVASEPKGKSMNEEQVKLLESINKMVLKLAEDQGELKKKLDEMPAAPPQKGASPAAPAADAGGKDDDDDVDLEEPNADPVKAKAQFGKMKKQLAEQKKQLEEYMKQAAVAEGDKKLAEKTLEFNVMLSEGKACAAQKDAFLKGDMSAFVKLSQPVNLESRGNGGGTGNEGGGDREDRVLKLAEKKVKEDKTLQLHDAITLANKEIKA